MKFSRITISKTFMCKNRIQMLSTGNANTVVILTELAEWTNVSCAKKVVYLGYLLKQRRKQSKVTNGSAVCVMKYKVSGVLKNVGDVGSNHLWLRPAQERKRYSQIQLKLNGFVTAAH